MNLRRFFLPIAGASALALVPRAASATQPLEEFLAKAKTHSYDVREIEATARQRDAEADAALGRLLPVFSARGIYTRNQYEVAPRLNPPAPALVIQPENQYDAFLQLDVPVIDLNGYYRYRAARAISRSTDNQKDATDLDTARLVSRAYYALLGSYGLLRSAKQSVDAADSNLKYVEVRRSAGAATELDRERARANVERAKQDVADAELLVALSARNLETLSGVTPAPADAFPQDDLHPEEPLSVWLGRGGDTPAERVAKEQSNAATEQKRAAVSALLPTLGLSAQERVTNATGFVGKNFTWLAQGILSWRLDYGTIRLTDAQAAASEAAQVRGERTSRGVADSIFEAYKRIEAGIAKSLAARAQASASTRAAELAADRYSAGAATQLDVTQAQRDAFLAEAARIQADADLIYSRAALRLAAGIAPSDRRPR